MKLPFQTWFVTILAVLSFVGCGVNEGADSGVTSTKTKTTEKSCIMAEIGRSPTGEAC